MHTPHALALVLLPLTLASSDILRKRASPLIPRQELGCGIAEELCGDGCISVTYTCCPSGAGGCPAFETCELGSNGEYGCCPVGETCVGEGGVEEDFGGVVPSVTIPSISVPDFTSAAGFTLPPVPTVTGPFPGGDDDDSDVSSSSDDTTAADSDSDTSSSSGGGRRGGSDASSVDSANGADAVEMTALSIVAAVGLAGVLLL